MKNLLKHHLVLLKDYSWSKKKIVKICTVTVFISIPAFISLIFASKKNVQDLSQCMPKHCIVNAWEVLHDKMRCRHWSFFSFCTLVFRWIKNMTAFSIMCVFLFDPWSSVCSCRGCPLVCVVYHNIFLTLTRGLMNIFSSWKKQNSSWCLKKIKALEHHLCPALTFADLFTNSAVSVLF